MPTALYTLWCRQTTHKAFPSMSPPNTRSFTPHTSRFVSFSLVAKVKGEAWNLVSWVEVVCDPALNPNRWKYCTVHYIISWSPLRHHWWLCIASTYTSSPECIRYLVHLGGHKGALMSNDMDMTMAWKSCSQWEEKSYCRSEPYPEWWSLQDSKISPLLPSLLLQCPTEF